MRNSPSWLLNFQHHLSLPVGTFASLQSQLDHVGSYGWRWLRLIVHLLLTFLLCFHPSFRWEVWLSGNKISIHTVTSKAAATQARPPSSPFSGGRESANACSTVQLDWFNLRLGGATPLHHIPYGLYWSQCLNLNKALISLIGLSRTTLSDYLEPSRS